MRKLFLGLALGGITAMAPAWTMAGEAEDRTAADYVKQNIKASGQLKDYSVGIKVVDGVATLSGKVRDQRQFYAAGTIAQQTPGVEEVVNNLNVVPLENESPVTRLTNAMSRTKEAPGANTHGVKRTSAEVSVKRPSSHQGQAQHAAPTAQQQQMMMQQQMQMQMQGQHPGMPTSATMGPYAQGGPGMMPPGPGAPMPMMGPVGPGGAPIPAYVPAGGGVSPARFDHPNMPNYAWPAYASHPNYAAVTYPKQYSATAWPYIGPFYPYPQVPLGWRKVTLEWDDGWWFLDFKDRH